MAFLLAGAEVDGGAIGEGDNRGVVAGLVNEVCLCVHRVSVLFWVEKRDVQTSGLGELKRDVCCVLKKLVEVRSEVLSCGVRRKWRAGGVGGEGGGE